MRFYFTEINFFTLKYLPNGYSFQKLIGTNGSPIIFLAINHPDNFPYITCYS